ncbi:MAG TPA: hypothetical protein VN956_09455, partial [Pyrinomonadaceae bacterium]|nr:hypothetical protein [Pyrinomonadaceae bacterium]
MGNVRKEPLTLDEITRFYEDGYIFPIRVLSERQAGDLRDALQDHLSGRIASPKYELTDPIRIRRVTDSGEKTTFEYEDDGITEPHTFPFLFNLWKRDERFREIGFDAVIAGMARQLLNANQ